MLAKIPKVLLITLVVGAGMYVTYLIAMLLGLTWFLRPQRQARELSFPTLSEKLYLKEVSWGLDKSSCVLSRDDEEDFDATGDQENFYLGYYDVLYKQTKDSLYLYGVRDMRDLSRKARGVVPARLPFVTKTRVVRVELENPALSYMYDHRRELGLQVFPLRAPTIATE